ncbi:MAG TPA: PqqD family protein [Pyrinomonadaceae bacterium]
MSERTVPAKPRARAEGVVVRELPEELLVYDLDTHKAVCLNSTAAAVWRLCDGRRTALDIRDSLEKSNGGPVPEEVVWLALEQLSKDKLLDARVPRPAALAGLTRREMIRRVGLGAAIAIPVVASIVAPTAVEAAASCLPSGTTTSDCAKCCTGTCTNGNVCV